MWHLSNQLHCVNEEKQTPYQKGIQKRIQKKKRKKEASDECFSLDSCFPLFHRTSLVSMKKTKHKGINLSLETCDWNQTLRVFTASPPMWFFGLLEFVQSLTLRVKTYLLRNREWKPALQLWKTCLKKRQLWKTCLLRKKVRTWSQFFGVFIPNFNEKKDSKRHKSQNWNLTQLKKKMKRRNQTIENQKSKSL